MQKICKHHFLKISMGLDKASEPMSTDNKVDTIFTTAHIAIYH